MTMCSPRGAATNLLVAATIGLVACDGGETSDTSTDAPVASTAITAAPVQPILPAEPSVPLVSTGDLDEHDQAGGGAPPPPEFSERSAPPSTMMLAIADRRFADLLAAVVDDQGLVRYDLLVKDRWSESLEKVVTAYGKTRLPETGDQRLVLWCNAYNANVLALVMAERRSGTVLSVNDVSGFFDDRPVTVAGETLTLNQLENDRIRPLRDPRIHAALVCAAMSCPPLRAEPYRVDVIDEQLDDQCRRWVNDASKNRAGDGSLELSKILDWYGDDFEAKPYGGPVGFIRVYAESGSAIGRAASVDSVEHGFLPYDWALNQAPIRETPEK